MTILKAQVAAVYLPDTSTKLSESGAEYKFIIEDALCDYINITAHVAGIEITDVYFDTKTYDINDENKLIYTIETEITCDNQNIKPLIYKCLAPNTQIGIDMNDLVGALVITGFQLI